MRRLILALLLGVLLAISTGSVAGAAKKPSTYDIQGTYTYHDQAFSITVGYVCPGLTTIWGADLLANYAATLKKSGSPPITVMRHAPWKLDVSLNEIFGLHLPEQAYQVLANDAATIACP
jgi:hypothetical protein